MKNLKSVERVFLTLLCVQLETIGGRLCCSCKTILIDGKRLCASIEKAVRTVNQDDYEYYMRQWFAHQYKCAVESERELNVKLFVKLRPKYLIKFTEVGRSSTLLSFSDDSKTCFSMHAS